MKKISFFLIAVLTLAWGVSSAQCPINTNNLTPGIHPVGSDTMTQGVAYTLTYQIYNPVTDGPYTVDSVHISSITGYPSGLTITYNPADNGGITVNGGAWGSICFNGTTTAAAGAYPLAFAGSVYVNGSTTGLPLSVLTITDTLFVKSAQSNSCDTLFNLLSTDTPYTYPVGVTVDSGFIGGNNTYGDLIKAEGFGATPGSYLNSALLDFGYAGIAPSDTGNIVTIGVWDNTGTSDAGNTGGPGNMIDSAHVTLGQIAQAVYATYVNQAQQPYSNSSLVGLLVNFQGGLQLTTDTFYVGVILPTGADTIALQLGYPGGDGDGWELSSAAFGGEWGTYNNDWGFGVNIGNYIAVSVCSAAETGVPVANFTASPTTICAPGTVSFTDASATTTPAASAWSWSFGDGTNGSSQKDPSHVFTTAGSYVVTEGVTNNYGSLIQAFVGASETITVNAAPTGNISVTDASTSSSDNGSLTATGSGTVSPYTYAWNNGSTTATISSLAPNTYTVTITDGNSCNTVDSATVFVTGIITLNNSSTVTVYPNPTNDVLNLVFSQKSNADVSIIDLSGKVITSFTTVGDLKAVYSVHELASGSYILRLTDKTSNQQQSLIFNKF